MTSDPESLAAEADVSEDVDGTGTRSTGKTQRISVLWCNTVGCDPMGTFPTVNWRTPPRTDDRQHDNDRGISDIYGVILMLGVVIITVFILAITVAI